MAPRGGASRWRFAVALHFSEATIYGQYLQSRAQHDKRPKRVDTDAEPARTSRKGGERTIVRGNKRDGTCHKARACRSGADRRRTDSGLAEVRQ